MALTKEQSLCQAIAHEEALLAKLARRQTESQERLAQLKAELAAIKSTPATPPPTIQPSTDIPTTAEEKIALFRRLFRGRDDVYPLLWISSKTGRTGYSPACGNEWGEVKALVQWTKEVHRTTGQDVRAGARLS